MGQSDRDGMVKVNAQMPDNEEKTVSCKALRCSIPIVAADTWPNEGLGQKTFEYKDQA